MTNQELADFMYAAGLSKLGKYERAHPSFDRNATWRTARAFIQIQVLTVRSKYFHVVYVIDRIFVHPRSRQHGFATRLMQALCAQADKDTITLKLYATNWLGADPFDLVAWYKRFGFASTGDMYTMERKPR